MAEKLASIARSRLIIADFAGRRTTAGNIAAPLQQTAFSLGPAYTFFGLWNTSRRALFTQCSSCWLLACPLFVRIRSVRAWDSMVYRLLGFGGAVASGVALWSFTRERWSDGVIWALVVAALAAAYGLGQRKMSKRGGKRRY